jgi:hypothetical protein
LVLAGFLSGCGNFTYHSNNTTSTTTDNGSDYICKDNNSTSCYTAGKTGYIDKNGEYNDVADVATKEYDPNWGPAECSAHGKFFCSIQQKCLDIPAKTGSCK